MKLSQSDGRTNDGGVLSGVLVGEQVVDGEECGEGHGGSG